MEGEVRVETDGYHTFMEKRDARARSERGDELESHARARMHLRLRRRLLIGGSVGAIAGAVIGALLGLLFFDRSAAVVMSTVAAGVFGLGVGMLIAGYSSLESPDPGAEPSDTARPVADRPEAVREEHPEVPDTPATGPDD
jgi:predicted phage tail protein